MEIEDPSEVQEMTIGKIEEMTDMYFPIRDKNGDPSYREHQAARLRTNPVPE